MNSLRIVPFCFVSLVLVSSALASDDCPTEAAALTEDGERAVSEQRLNDALAHYEEAARLCDKPSYWQAVGDTLLAMQEQGNTNAEAEAEEEEEEEEGGAALEAFGNAFAAARRSQDDVAGATAARSIVELGLRAGDPLKAQNWLLIAQQLDEEHPDIPALQEAVDSARLELSASEIDTGFSQTRGLGRVNNLMGGGVTASTFWESPGAPDETANQLELDPLDESQGGGGQSTVSIPINFVINSTEVTSDTAGNVKNLATVLAGQPESVKVTLIGHADERGDETYNLELSRDRAEQIRLTLIRLEPVLDGRIQALGAGESEPIDRGYTSRAHANNRRLEVTLSE